MIGLEEGEGVSPSVKGSVSQQNAASELRVSVHPHMLWSPLVPCLKMLASISTAWAREKSWPSVIICHAYGLPGPGHLHSELQKELAH